MRSLGISVFFFSISNCLILLGSSKMLTETARGLLQGSHHTIASELHFHFTGLPDSFFNIHLLDLTSALFFPVMSQGMVLFCNLPTIN